MSIDLKKYYCINGCFLSFLLIFIGGILKQEKLLTVLSYATLALVLGFLSTFIVLSKNASPANSLLKSHKKKG